MYEFIVCDDNNEFINEVKTIIDKVMSYNINYKVYLFNNYDEDFINMMYKYDKNRVYVLSISINSLLGIEMAQLIRKKDKNSIIIFIGDDVSLSYKLVRSHFNFLTYVLKNEDYFKNMCFAINEALAYYGENRLLKLCEGYTNYYIKFDCILFIYKLARKTIIKTDANEYSIYVPMKKIISLLDDSFLQVHKSCYVNMKRVESMNYGDKIIRFDNGASTDLISRKYHIKK